MEFWQKQKKVLAAFAIFLAFMFLCTLISRSVYASGLPQVSVETPRRMAISHKVDAEGIVHQGQEHAVNVLSGLRVKTVYAHTGDKITSETLLFEVDTEDLEKMVREQEIAIKKLQLQISDQEKNKELEEINRQIDSARTQEDYARANQEAQIDLNQAEKELEQARNELKKKKDNPVSVTSEESRKAAQDSYNAWVQEGAKLKDALEQAKKAYEAAKEEVRKLEESVSGSDGSNQEELANAREKEKAAQKSYEDANAAYLNYVNNPMAKPDFSAEDSARAGWEAEKAALEDKVNAAEQAVEDVKRTNQDSLLEAGRKVEDENRESQADSSLEINRLELSLLQQKQTEYQEILKNGGKVYPKEEGIVTRIQVNPGERVPDGAAVVYADLSSPMEFHVTLTKEQKKYVNQGDTIELSLGSSSEEYEVDYIAENEANPELYEATVFLPEGVGSLGQSGSFKAEAQSETFACCIPASALWEDGNHRKYVYMVSEKEGILGKELAAEVVYVKVLDQNDSYVAVEEGIINRDTELIINSTEPLEDRDVIRYR